MILLTSTTHSSRNKTVTVLLLTLHIMDKDFKRQDSLAYWATTRASYNISVR